MLWVIMPGLFLIRILISKGLWPKWTIIFLNARKRLSKIITFRIEEVVCRVIQKGGRNGNEGFIY